MKCCQRDQSLGKSRCPGHFIPDTEAFGSESSVISSGEQVASGTKVRGYDAVDLDESLGVSGGLEPPHSPLALTGRLMRVLDAR